SWPADIDADGTTRLANVDNFVVEQHLDVWEPLHPLQEQVCGLELLALNNEGMPGIPRKDRMMELRHESIGRPIPELKDRRDQSSPCHLLVQPASCRTV